MAQNHFSIKSGSTTSAITPWKWNLENINVPTTKCTKLCIVDTWSVRVAHQKFIHHVSNHWQNSMIFPGWCFQIPCFSQVWKFFFSFSRFPWFFQRLENLSWAPPSPRIITFCQPTPLIFQMEYGDSHEIDNFSVEKCEKITCHLGIF